MKNWTIKKRVILGLSLLVLINVIVGVLTSLSINKLKFYADDIHDNQFPSVETLSQLLQQTTGVNVLLLKHIMSSTPADVQANESQITAARESIDKELGDYKLIADADPVEKPFYDKTIEARDTYRAAWAPVRQLSSELKDAAAYDLFQKQVEPALLKYHEALQAEIDYNKNSANTESTASANLANASAAGVNVSVIITLLAGGIIGYLIVRSLNGVLTQVAETLGEGASQIVSASSQLASASQALAQGASEQAASLEETSAALEEIGSMTKRNAENAKHAQTLSSETRTAAETGAQRTEEMQGAMEAIQLASNEMGQAILGIKASSNDVSKIISTIDEIAFQTNILALNAAVEAARAGEAGMGFAVVAEEVRNLAKRSADAAKETAQMIESSVNQSNCGVEVNSKVASRIAEVVQKANGVRESLNHIVTKAREVDSLVGQITDASKEQNTGLEQINSAIAQMNQVTQANAAGSEQTASASEELTAQSVELRAGVEVLVKLVKGNSAVPRESSKSKPSLQKSMPLSIAPMTLTRRQNQPVATAKHNGHNGHNGNDPHDSFMDM